MNKILCEQWLSTREKKKKGLIFCDEIFSPAMFNNLSANHKFINAICQAKVSRRKRKLLSRAPQTKTRFNK